MTIQQVIDKIIAYHPPLGEREATTCDTVKFGDTSITCTGIATAIYPSPDIIRKAAAAGCNLLVVHEPSFYSHMDPLDWLSENQTANCKMELLRQHQMVILREKQELSMYNLQVNPHFVLNSLNIINLELLKKGEDDLSEMISKMASIMDYTLNTQAVMVPFWMDWEHTLAYMDIMRKRYGGQFTYRLDIQPDLREQLIPKFLLQPLIENAILKGNRNVSGPFRIEIHAGRCPEGMLFEVTDNGKGISEEKRREILDKKPSEGAQHAGGINNVRYRIQCIYGEQYDISIESEPYVKTRIIIRLPLAPRLPVTP